jgi:hypothetical protein
VKELDVAVLLKDYPEGPLKKGDRVALLERLSGGRAWLVEGGEPHGGIQVFVESADLEIVWEAPSASPEPQP